MNKNQSGYPWITLLIAVSLSLMLTGCGGSDGAAGTPGASVAPLASSTALNIEVTGVTVPSDGKPVVNFTVTNQDGVAVAGFADGDLRFNIAKLVPGSNGAPSNWQNYINHTSVGLTHGYQERASTGGTLLDNKNGTFVYTFKTDITSGAALCPGPCTDVYGNALDVSYQPSLTHRVSIQQGNSAYPRPNAAYDFVPAGGAVTVKRDIVKTETCNQCHNKLAMHGGGRIETRLCVTCHNPGTTRQGKIGTVSEDVTVDFKVLIHKLHRGEFLPSVTGPDGIYGDDSSTTGVDESLDDGDYGINGYTGSLVSFKDVEFPQDIRNCTKCHDGTAGASNHTTQGDNWKTQPSKAACTSCHDDLYFGAAAGKAYQTVSHVAQAALKSVTVGYNPSDDMCISCHGVGQVADVVVAHTNPTKAGEGKFVFEILEICGTPVASTPVCADNTAPVVKFQVSDPTPGATHKYGGGSLYDVAGATDADRDPEFTYDGASSTRASLNIVLGWMSGTSDGSKSAIDFTNDGGAGTRPSRANGKNAITGATDVGDGTFTITLDTLPAGVATSGVVAMEGHPKIAATSIPVKGAVAYFGITGGVGGAAVTRRVAVDVTAKCDKCHDHLSLHGANRADNAQLCVVCHNPRNTDISQRDTSSPKDGIPDVSALDGKREESIDMKRLIHGVHAGAASGHGIREKGLVVYGYGGSTHEFGHLRFPGILNDCTTCHNDGAYELTGKWATPLQSGILATTMLSVPGDYATLTSADVITQSANQADDLMTTPTAAVCSACHDSTLAQTHMETIGGAKFSVMQAIINTSYETCSVCHGPGRIADVKVVHSVQ